MILTCPQCDVRFLLPAIKLAPNGAKVRCSACSEVWFEMPNEDELAEFSEGGESSEVASEGDIDDIFNEEPKAEPSEEAGEASKEDIDSLFDSDSEPSEDAGEASEDKAGEDKAGEDIPQSVQPIKDEDAASKKSSSDDENLTWKSRKCLISYGVGAVLFVLITGVLVYLHAPITKKYPATQSFYGLVGVAADIAGEGIVFDKITADVIEDAQGAQKIEIKGELINLKSRSVDIPMIEATLRDDEAMVVKQWLIEPPKGSLDSHGQITFYVEYPNHPLAKEISLRFVLRGAKTASKGGDNTPAHSEGDDTPHSDGAAH